MENLFTYNHFVTGDSFVSRKQELEQLQALIDKGQNALIYEAHKSGKNSLIQQLQLHKQKRGTPLKICSINLFNLRSTKQFLSSYITAIQQCCTLGSLLITQPTKELIAELKIEIGQLKSQAEITNPPHPLIKAVLELPEIISNEIEEAITIHFSEFQELLKFEDKSNLLELMDKLLPLQQQTNYIITGSMVNAMKLIFEEVKYLYNFATRVKLSPLLKKELIEYYQKQFLKTGRVVSNKLASQMYDFIEGHPWYAQQLGEITYSHTRGFLTQEVLQKSFTSLLHLHSYRYQIITSNLSRYQISFLKAVLDGVTLFSSSKVIQEYSLSSSANVNRQKESFKRKEILTEEGGKMEFIDPLFKIWLKEHYFKD